MKPSRKKRQQQALASVEKRANRKREEIVRRLQDPMTVLENMVATYSQHVTMERLR